MAPVEVITSVQRRRRWSTEEKQRIVAESARPGRTASQVARAHGIPPSQLFTWRRQALAAAVADDPAGDGFLPVRIGPAAMMPSLPVSPRSGDALSRVEITLPSGVRIGVGKDVDVETLRRVLTALMAP